MLTYHVTGSLISGTIQRDKSEKLHGENHSSEQQDHAKLDQRHLVFILLVAVSLLEKGPDQFQYDVRDHYIAEEEIEPDGGVVPDCRKSNPSEQETEDEKPPQRPVDLAVSVIDGTADKCDTLLDAEPPSGQFLDCVKQQSHPCNDDHGQGRESIQCNHFLFADAFLPVFRPFI